MALPEKQVDISEFKFAHGSLRPITAVSTDRYANSARQAFGTSSASQKADEPDSVALSHLQIVPGLYTEPEPKYLPHQWDSYVHPEGQVYFCRHSAPRVITEAYLFNEKNMLSIANWLGYIEAAIADRDLELTPDVELFLQLEETGCAYYFIDHATRSEFWVEHVDTEQLGIRPVASPSHLKVSLEEHYWTHVERFPMHFGGLQPQVIDELSLILNHGQLDRLTSSVSTFPYTPDDFTRFKKILRDIKDHANDGYAICTVARLWTAVSNHRFITHFGQEHARLSRDQTILHKSHPEQSCIPRLASRLTLGISNSYLENFENVLIDDLVYIEQWNKFITICMQDWKTSMCTSFAVLLLHISLFFAPSVPVSSVIASATCFSASIISAVLLVYRHEPLVDTTAAEAANYLLGIRSEKSRFHSAARVFALPKALSFWGMGFFSIHWLAIVAIHIHTGLALGLSAFIILLIFAIRSNTSCEEYTIHSYLPSWFSRKPTDELPV